MESIKIIKKYNGKDLEFEIRPYTVDWQIVERGYDEYRRAFCLPMDNLPIIDIGSHVGAFSRLAAETYPLSKIYCFEPDPESYSLLLKNMEGTNCVLCNKGVSNNKKYGKLFKDTDPCMNRTIWEDIPQKALWCSNLETVECIPINDILDQFEEVGILKMDCEGAERVFLPYLSNGNKNKIRFIIGETHDEDTPQEWRIQDFFPNFTIIEDDDLFFGWRKDIDYKDELLSEDVNSYTKIEVVSEEPIIDILSKNLVLTIAIGDNYKKIADLTSPTMKSYAAKIGAEFLCITEQRISTTYPYWEKFVIGELLNSYNRIIYLDVDTLVRKDCPSLFDIVPLREIGLYNEGLLTNDTEKTEHIITMQKVFEEYEQSFPNLWDGRFYNSGVMVVPQNMKWLFKKPEKETFANYWDQSYINMMLSVHGSLDDVFDIGYKFNRMYYVDSKVKEDRSKSYIIHYAGLSDVILNASQDLSRWGE